MLWAVSVSADGLQRQLNLSPDAHKGGCIVPLKIVIVADLAFQDEIGERSLVNPVQATQQAES